MNLEREVPIINEETVGQNPSSYSASSKFEARKDLVQRAIDEGIFGKLTTRQQEIIQARYGSENFRSIREVADDLKTTFQNVSVVELGGLRRLQRLLSRKQSSLNEPQIEQPDQEQKGFESAHSIKQPEDLRIDDIAFLLTPRIVNAIRRSKYASYTPQQLEQLSEDDLFEIKGIGWNSVRFFKSRIRTKSPIEPPRKEMEVTVDNFNRESSTEKTERAFQKLYARE